ncbi:MAG: adenosylcobinamide-GDP ribazoletransferase [Parvibaculaceae bacterium]|nr:adenosylcobinamide-GDP ribazoletransferase [Parvibaculaceae bacterium]
MAKSFNPTSEKSTNGPQSDPVWPSTKETPDPVLPPRDNWREISATELSSDFVAVLGARTQLAGMPVEQPVPDPARAPLRPADLRRDRALPLVGAVIGLLGGMAFLLLAAADLPELVCAALAVGVMILTQGAAREDGLVETVNRLARRSANERSHSPMPSGATALVLLLIVQVGLIAGISTASDAGMVLLALIASQAMAGFAGLLFRHFVPIEGVDTDHDVRPRETTVIQGLIFTGIVCFLTLPALLATLAIAAACAALIIMGFVVTSARGTYRPYDVLTIELISEVAFLTAVFMVLEKA